MADHSKIEWTDATWNPIAGCSVVSPGCTNCYAMRLAGTRLRHHPTRSGLTTDSKAGPVWNGQVRLNEKALLQPLSWSRPRMIFVCAHGDLFHESVPDEWIDKVFAVMALCPQHTFQVLTKRAERMREYITGANLPPSPLKYESANSARDDRVWRAQFDVDRAVGHALRDWPLPNVWLGVSAEDQTRYNERKDFLRRTPAVARFFSMEPLIGPIEVDYLGDWVIVGGESGKGARPMHPDWARSLRDQCAAAGVPFFFKQWGEHVWLQQGAGSGLARWPDGIDRRVVGKFEPGFFRVGKMVAGRLLDGIEHNAMPEAPR